MRILRTLAITAILALPVLGTAQEKEMMDKKDATISSETTMKSYTIDQGDTQVTNKVKIETMRSQELALSKEDENQVNQDRVYPEKHVTKQVWIDNDADSDYDETLKFRYTKPSVSHNDSDFVLVTNNEEIFVAVDNGNSLQILEAVSIMKDDWKLEAKESLIYTDNEGNTINFYIDTYERMTSETTSSK
ncbi:hypothetical protein [Robiginitalea sp. SC105]|uniref:hypothetical protein n=1 Tax=Robiginitalea sp. SC105 TaxID=2762332 RepID=UPI0016399EBB|nr:hypothetical protein [Robiginitalea sp. SC105]MBC2840588.1 hypothetical protein [Robiginitalea sp. SC105]